MLKEEYVIVQCWSWILRIWNPAGESHEGRHSNAALIILETIWSSLPSSLSAPQQFKERKVAGKGTIHVETPGLYLYIWRPFLFSLYCYQDMFWKVLKFIFQIYLLGWTIQFHYLICIWIPACESISLMTYQSSSLVSHYPGAWGAGPPPQDSP